MKRIKKDKRNGARGLSPALLALAIAATLPAQAATFNLRAEAFLKTMPDGAVVTMWGYALCNAAFTSCAAPTSPGPVLTVPVGDASLTLNLFNALPQVNDADVPTSLVINGQSAAMTPVYVTDAQGRQRVRSFTHETARNTSNTYTWTGLKPGSYLYQSGTHPGLQVQMGLSGAMKHDAALLQAYSGVPYNYQAVLVYSEVDAAFHAAVAGSNDANALTTVGVTMDYQPGYFLINGDPYPATPDVPIGPGTAGQRVLLRFLNAGLETHVPTLDGLYMDVVAEDGHLAPYATTLYSAFLPAGKRVDAVLTVPAAPAFGRHAVYDSRMKLTNATATGGGMLTFLATAADTDNDGVVDIQDNCTLVANANQRDTNGDGYGNRCDPDLNNNGLVNSLDEAMLRTRIGSADPDADLDGNGIVNAIDRGILRSYFGQPPGPSGVAP